MNEPTRTSATPGEKIACMLTLVAAVVLVSNLFIPPKAVDIRKVETLQEAMQVQVDNGIPWT